MRKWCAIVAATALLALTGCATAPSKPKMDPEVAAIGPPLTMAMMQIREKALEPPDMDRLFAAGLSELSKLDHNLRFEVRDDSLIVRHGEVLIERTPRPAPGDIDAWVADIDTLLASARLIAPSFGMVPSETLLQTLFDGIMPAVDPYSHYAGQKEAARNRINRDGFVGLGFDLEPVPNGALVQSVTKNGPAERAGIMPGDVIVRVNGARLAHLPLPAILHRLDGARDSLAVLTIDRAGKAETFKARRAFIIPDSVKADVTDGVLRIAVKHFNQQTATAVADAFAQAGPVRGVILDLRGDPGGLLDQAIAVADLFLDHGTIATLRGRYAAANQFYAATPGAVATDVPMAILVDGLTASASEIVAAALQENGRAIVIGTASVGKGTVQTLVPLANGGELSLTWAKVFTPDGALLHERGILPDICTTAPPTGLPPSAGDIISMAMRKRTADSIRKPVFDVRAARSACQPEPHITQATDMETARRWITDAALRASLPALPTQSAEVSH